MSISDNDSCSSASDTETDTDSCALEKKLCDAVPKQEMPAEKPKRKYARKPLTPEQKTALVERLAKARAAKKVKTDAAKQGMAQETAELKEIKKMKDAGEVKIVKKETKPRKPRVKKVTEIHNHYSAPAPEPAPQPKKTPRTPAAKPMLFA